MPLGYVLKTEQVLEYYTRRDVMEAIFGYGKDRNVIMTTDPGMLGRGGGQPGFQNPNEISALAMQAMEGQEGTVPKKYPAFHGTIGRFNQSPKLHRRQQYGADLVIDIDIKDNFRGAFREGRKVIDFLDSYHVPYRIKFSGGSGPHIIVPYEAFPEGLSGGSFDRAHKLLFKVICSSSRASHIDSSFTSTGHFFRIPYSMNEHTGLVSLPLRKEQYDDFHPSMAEIQNFQIDEEWFQKPDVTAKEAIAEIIKDGLGGPKNIKAILEPSDTDIREDTFNEIQRRAEEHLSRIQRLIELDAPDKVVRNERKMLKEVTKMLSRRKNEK